PGPDSIAGGAGAAIVTGAHGIIDQAGFTQRLVSTGRVTSVVGNEFDNGVDDVLFGGSGDDIIIGGTGADEIDGNEGADVIFGDHGLVDLTGAGYAGTIEPTVGDVDRIEGGAGNDRIFGGARSE